MGLFDFIETVPTVAPTTAPASDWRPEAPPVLDRYTDIELDIESDGLDWRGGHRVGGIGICLDGKTMYLPFRHQGGNNLDEAVVKEWAQRELRGKKITNHSIKFDIQHLRAWGVDLEEQGCTVADISFDFALLDDHRYPNKMSQADLCEDFLPETERKATVVRGIELNPERMMQYPADLVAVRCEADVRQVYLLKKVARQKILKEGLEKVQQVENDCIFAVCEMERNGIPMDVEKLHRWHREVTTRNNQTLMAISQTVGFMCSPDSTKDMVRVFEKFGLDIPTKNGKPTFTDEVLQGVDHPVIQTIRKYGKAISLLAKLTEYKNAVGADGVLHYSLHQLLCEEGGTITGRFSSSNVNIQQVMKTKKQRATFGDEYLIRELFVPGSGLFFSADGRQIEYRIFAHYADSPRINRAFAEDPLTNFHQLIFQMLKPHAPKLIYEDVKNINFMRIYGGGIIKLAQMMGYVTKSEADALQAERDEWRKVGNRGLPKQPALDTIMAIDAIYNRKLPEVKPLLEKTKKLAEERGFVRTMLGRRGRFPGHHKRWSYKAFNVVGQGGGADLMKIKIIDLHRARKKTGFVMRATVHDQVLGDVPDGRVCTIGSDYPRPPVFQVACAHTLGGKDRSELEGVRLVKIHPLAEAYAMLSQEELKDLANDIQLNGLNHPIVMWTDHEGIEWLIEGRNRLAACELAGVDPQFTRLNGKQDVASYILSENDKRRHLNKGQRAMGFAILRPSAGQGARTDKLTSAIIAEVQEPSDVSERFIYYARFIFRHAPTLALQVRDGSKALADAYEEARQQKKKADTDAANLLILKTSAPDLALLVDEERMSLTEAYGAYEARVKAQKEKEVQEKREAEKRAKELRAVNEDSTQHFINSAEMLDTLLGTETKFIEQLWEKLIPDMFNERTLHPELWEPSGLIELGKRLQKFGEYVRKQGGLRG